MSLIKWRKKGEMFPSLSAMIDNFFSEDEGFFGYMPEKMKMPAVNVKETDKSFEVEVAAPGFNKEDFKVEIDNGVLTISSETKDEKEEKKENFTRKEFSYSSFSRSFWLPENVEEEDIKAEYTNGVLRLNIAKKEGEPKSQAKKIEVS